jgi:hypothetical protein
LTSAQTGLPSYVVIDGQQRLRAIFEFLDDRFRLTQSQKRTSYYNKRFSDLSNDLKDRVRNYDLIIEELSGYTDADIRDMFVRMNKYVVKLSPQELRHAKGVGRFHDFAEALGRDPFWKAHKIFSPAGLKRMRSIEFSAELAILIIEGPQDKKASIELYYGQYRNQFPYAKAVASKLRGYFDWIERALPDLSETRFRSPVDFYSLVGALDALSSKGGRLSAIKPEQAGERLRAFEKKTRAKEPVGDAARYVAAASRQTDNLIPRTTRIDILDKILKA